MNGLESKVLGLVASNGPIKARQLSKVLSDEFAEHVDRSSVNRVLYALERAGKVRKSKSHEWSATPTGKADSRASRNSPELKFTADQQAIVELSPEGNLLIRGQAGSGKTTVLAARAGLIRSALNKGTVLFLTYNGALAEHVMQSFRGQGLADSVQVMTFHQWCRDVSVSLGSEISSWVDARGRKERLKKLIAEISLESDHRLLDLSEPNRLDWWGDEIAWMLGQYFERLRDYQLVERAGRGVETRVTKADREVVWEVYEAYCEYLEEEGAEDYDNPAGPLLRALERTGLDALPDEHKFDHVMIDEVQDFDRSWLLAAAHIPRVSLSMAGDLAQRIYRRSFSWRSVGIELRSSRSRLLGGSHRTTRQIVDVAQYIVEGDELSTDPDYVAPALPSRDGPKVRLIIGEEPRDAYDRGYEYIASEFGRLRSKTVAVALPFSRQCYAAAKALEALNCKAKALRGAQLGRHAGGIAITTLHQLKGLEFDHVVILGMHDSQFPGRLLADIPGDEQESIASLARRLLYVALTRARVSATIVGSDPLCRFFDPVPDAKWDRI